MRVLIVDEDIENVSGLVNNFNNYYITDVAYNGNEGTYLSQINEYDAIVVNSSISDIDSIEFCEKTRNSDVISPILLLMDSNNDTSYKVKILDAGADDYVTKPVDASELSAKIRALIRRKNLVHKSSIIKIDNLVLNIYKRTFSINSCLVPMRRKEYDLLEYLFVNSDRVVTKEELLDHIWDNGILVLSNTLEVHIRSVRKLLKKYLKADIIKTVRGFGYKLDVTIDGKGAGL